MVEVNLSIDDDNGVILYNGNVYRKEEAPSEEMWGRYEVATHLGFRTRVKTGEGFKEIVNTANLYNGDAWRKYFPDFGKALDDGVLKPYPKDVMLLWLGKSKSERKKMFENGTPFWIYKE